MTAKSTRKCGTRECVSSVLRSIRRSSITVSWRSGSQISQPLMGIKQLIEEMQARKVALHPEQVK
jgi:hypothetical protein